MIKALDKLRRREDLNEQDMFRAVEGIVSGALEEALIEEFLLLLREKGETALEIASAAKVMRRHAVKLQTHFPDLLDTCGTGGDAKNTLNISTLSAIVASSAGVQVGKHGNRSVSSSCGSADLLELLGVTIDLSPAAIERCIQTVNFGFFFAPHFHPATKYAMPARKKIQGKTIFNVLGPLSNPGGASRQLIGVYSDKLVGILAEVLSHLGSTRALVVHGADGLDEISISDKTLVSELNHGKVSSYSVSPQEYGLKAAPLSSIACRTKEEARDRALRVLEGEVGPAADIVSLNAGAALYIAGKTASIREGLLLSRELLTGGAAMEKLEEIREFTSKNARPPA